MSRKYAVKFVNEWKKKNTVCAHCGGTFLPCQIDIHHIDESTKNPKLNGYRIDGSKVQRQYNIKQLGSIRLIKLELEKCITLCKNCHALHHHLERQGKQQETPADMGIEQFME